MLMYGYPQIFKEIFKNFPTLALKTISWSDFIRESGTVYRNYLKGEIPKSLLAHLEKILPKEITLVRKIDSSHYIDGEILLKVYFSQFLNPNGIVIDLRPQHFSIKNQFKAPAFWYKFQDSFRENIINLYKGFYYNDNELFSSSLDNLGMTTGLGTSEKEELKNLFKNHFGKNTHTVHFTLEAFNQSFLEIFKFFMKHEIKLPVDFIFLGVYLTTLYSHLENHKEALDVEAIFKDLYSAP